MDEADAVERLQSAGVVVVFFASKVFTKV